MKKKSITITILCLLCVALVLFIFFLKDIQTKDPSLDKASIPEHTDSVSTTTDFLQGNISPEFQVGSSIIESTGTTTESTEVPDFFDIELEIMYQYPELPAGCESVSLTMILNYLGYDLDKTDIVDNYLVYSGNFVTGYHGNPYSYSSGGGIYAPGMTTTANAFFSANGNKHIAENITGTKFYTLLDYVAKGYPILVWSTIGMTYETKGYYNYDADGNAYAWDYNEHCVVLAGYDYKAKTVTIYDPIDGIIYRDMEAFKELYENMYEMAIIIKAVN